MVEFLKDVKGKDFVYKKGQRYPSMGDLKENELSDKILVRQPNSPKKTNWWSTMPKSEEGITFRTLNNGELTLSEMIEENKILQY